VEGGGNGIGDGWKEGRWTCEVQVMMQVMIWVEGTRCMQAVCGTFAASSAMKGARQTILTLRLLGYRRSI
jgi:hypothetical protein